MLENNRLFTIKNFLPCKTLKLCIVVAGGGALMIWLFCAIGFDLNQISAQATYQVNCNQLSVEFVPQPFTGNNDQYPCSTCCTGKIDCDRIEYEVYLRAANIPGGQPLPLSGNFTLSYEELYLVLHLNRVNAVVSNINTLFTEACLSSTLSSAADDFQADMVEDEVSLRLSLATGGPIPPINFSNFRSVRLFSVVVDAFPGEEFGISCTTFTYNSAEDGCTGDCPGVPPAIFPMPSTPNPNITLSLGNIDCNPEEYIDVPVVVNANLQGGSINLLDFGIVVNNTAPDGFFAAPEFLSILPGTNPDVMVEYNDNTGQYIVRIMYTAQNPAPLNGGNVQLGVLRIYRPPILCQGYTISASVVPGRIRMFGGFDNGCKAIQVGGTGVAQCVVPAMPVCTEDFQLNITAEPNPPTCNTIVVYATLSWDPVDFGGATQLPFHQVRTILEFDMDNGISISDVQMTGMSCPQGNDPLLCPGNCLQYNAGTVELCINSGSAVMVNNGAVIAITFNAPTGCIQGVTVRKMALRRPGNVVCQPDVNPPLGLPYCSPGVVTSISGKIATETGCWVDEALVAWTPTNSNAGSCGGSLLTGSIAGTECFPYMAPCLCNLNNAGSYTVTPEKNDNPLNGVTTYDLVLISKHLVENPKLDSPYKIIAADANKSGSVTTFDIIEIRKLILGVYTELPNNTSWRFVPQSFDFPNTSNPFEGTFPENKVVSSLPDNAVDFVGIKVGDVNNTVSASDCDNCDAFMRPAAPVGLRESWHPLLKAGDYVTLPMVSEATTPLIAWQGAFSFDPTLLELVGPSVGDVAGLNADCFNLTQANEGLIRALWFAPGDAEQEAWLQPGQQLFNLTFKVKQDIAQGKQLIHIDKRAMPDLCWTADGVEHNLQTAGPAQRAQQQSSLPEQLVKCYPNPSLGAVSFDIAALPASKRMMLVISDAFGNPLWHQQWNNPEQPVHLVLQEIASWAAGVYHWELRYDKQRQSGSFVKQ